VRRIGHGSGEYLHGVANTRAIESAAQTTLPPHTLMQRAGLAVARLAMATAPHARRIWVACGPGNNGGDGLETAIHLHRWGKVPVLTWLGSPGQASPDSLAAHEKVRALGLAIADEPPAQFDMCIDALLGIGATAREPHERMARWINHMNSAGAPILAIDVPSGLNPGTGSAPQLHVKASRTLSLLTLKPGLFTGQGRDACGDIWFDDLGVPCDAARAPVPIAQLNTAPSHAARPHASHKGSFGDVAVIGGAPGMTGAALLAASAALHAGAGRVYVGLLDRSGLKVNPHQPELMFRPIEDLDSSNMTIVCGCGGGAAVAAYLQGIFSALAPVVIDADAINSISSDLELQKALRHRSSLSFATVLTPHPLEAARLLGCSTAQVQQDRLSAAQSLAALLACNVILKGSGTVIAAPGHTTVLNATGNARLASAGTGDVLAGMVGAHLAAGFPAFQAACMAVYDHGALADSWQASTPLTASQLASQLATMGS
jgi:ADP-dependent NAD(P)H-hydrate dehydratase / NAD(P)H-hydrate epimerase